MDKEQREAIEKAAKLAFRNMCEWEEKIDAALNSQAKIVKRRAKSDDGESVPYLTNIGTVGRDRPRILAVSSDLDAEALRPIVEAREAAAAEFRELRAQLSSKDLIEAEDGEDHIINGSRITAPIRLICADGIHEVTPETIDAAVESFNASAPLRSISYRRHRAQSSLIVRTEKHRERVLKSMTYRVRACKEVYGIANSILRCLRILREHYDITALSENFFAKDQYKLVRTDYEIYIEAISRKLPKWEIDEARKILDRAVDELIEAYRKEVYRLLCAISYYECYPEIDAILPDNFTFRVETGYSFYIRVNYDRKGIEFRLGTIDVIKSEEELPDWKTTTEKPSRALLTEVYSSILLPHAVAADTKAKVDEIVERHRPAPS